MAYPYYFLSTSIEAKPAANIGAFGLCLSSAAIPLTAFIRHARVKFAAEGVVDVGMRKKARSLNTKALKIVVVAAISGVGVASFQSTVDACGGTIWIIGVHLVFALVFFVGGMRYCMLQHKIDCLVPTLGTTRERRLRKLFARATVFQLAMLGVLLVVAMILFIVLNINSKSGIFSTADERNSSVPTSLTHAQSDPQSALPPTSEISTQARAIIFCMSVFEVSLLLTFMMTFITFWDSFSTTKFAVVVMDTGQEYTLRASPRHARSKPSDAEAPDQSILL